MINEEDEFTVSIPFVSDKTTNKPPTNHQQTTNKTTNKTTHKPPTNHLQQIVLGVLHSGEKGIVELMEACGYKDKRSFRKSVINELIRRTRQTLWEECTDANPKLSLNDT